MAVAAEAAGFDGIGFTDHPAPSQRWLDAAATTRSTRSSRMGFCAAATERLRLIPNIVVLPYRNPLIVAKAGATLDVLSGGRFTLAVGTGYLRSEFAALGVDPDERNELFDEALGVIKAVWTDDDVSVEGRHFSARGVTSHPRPGQPVADLDRWQQCPGAPASGRPRRRVGAVPRARRPRPHRRRPQRSTTVDDVTHGDRRPARSAACRQAAMRPSVDVSFTCTAGGNPAADDFDADAHLDGLAALAAAGVTWVQVGLPGDDIERTVATIERYGELVIARADARRAVPAPRSPRTEAALTCRASGDPRCRLAAAVTERWRRGRR